MINIDWFFGLEVWLQFLVLAIAAVVFGLLLLIPVQLILTKTIFRQNQAELRLRFYQVLRLLVPLLIFMALSKAFTPQYLPEFISQQLLPNILVVLFVWLLIVFADLVKEWILIKYDIHKADNQKERKIYTQLLFLKRVFIVIVVVIAVGSLLMSNESFRKMGAGILTSAGVLGIIIGFAAQKSLANLLAGLQIAFTQPIKIDDVVVVEGEWGKVEEINLTYVVVKIWDQRRLVLPINYFIEKPFQNWTRKTADIWGTVFIYVDYTVNVAALRDKLTEILKNSQYWDGQLNVLQVTNATDKSMEIRCLMSAKDSPTAFDLRCEVREKMINYIQKEYPNSLPKIRFEKEGINGGA